LKSIIVTDVLSAIPDEANKSGCLAFEFPYFSVVCGEAFFMLSISSYPEYKLRVTHYY
jgi:hypothetical protein